MILELEDGARLQYEDHGCGEALILLPFLGRGYEDYRSVLKRIVASGRRAIAVNPRGIGQSAAQSGVGSPAVCAADVLRLADHLGIERAHLFGHAYGSRVARMVAERRPSFVISLTLAGTGGETSSVESSRPQFVARGFFSALAALQQSPSSLQARAAAKLLRKFYFGVRADTSRAWHQGWWPKTALAQFQALEQESLNGWSMKCRAPVLVLQGALDRLSPSQSARALRRKLGGRVRIVYFEGAGHALLPEAGPAIEQALISFLSETGAALSPQVQGRPCRDVYDVALTNDGFAAPLIAAGLSRRGVRVLLLTEPPATLLTTDETLNAAACAHLSQFAVEAQLSELAHLKHATASAVAASISRIGLPVGSPVELTLEGTEQEVVRERTFECASAGGGCWVPAGALQAFALDLAQRNCDVAWGPFEPLSEQLAPKWKRFCGRTATSAHVLDLARVFTRETSVAFSADAHWVTLLPEILASSCLNGMNETSRPEIASARPVEVRAAELRLQFFVRNVRGGFAPTRLVLSGAGQEPDAALRALRQQSAWAARALRGGPLSPWTRLERPGPPAVQLSTASALVCSLDLRSVALAQRLAIARAILANVEGLLSGRSDGAMFARRMTWATRHVHQWAKARRGGDYLLPMSLEAWSAGGQ